VTDRRILGHESVGTITEVDTSVGELVVGDQVIISWVSACGTCTYCRRQLPSYCWS
jgi:alcohol dehydrogenase